MENQEDEDARDEGRREESNGRQGTEKEERNDNNTNCNEEEKTSSSTSSAGGTSNRSDKRRPNSYKDRLERKIRQMNETTEKTLPSSATEQQDDRKKASTERKSQKTSNGQQQRQQHEEEHNNHWNTSDDNETHSAAGLSSSPSSYHTRLAQKMCLNNDGIDGKPPAQPKSEEKGKEQQNKIEQSSINQDDTGLSSEESFRDPTARKAGSQRGTIPPSTVPEAQYGKNDAGPSLFVRSENETDETSDQQQPGAYSTAGRARGSFPAWGRPSRISSQQTNHVVDEEAAEGNRNNTNNTEDDDDPLICATLVEDNEKPVLAEAIPEDNSFWAKHRKLTIVLIVLVTIVITTLIATLLHFLAFNDDDDNTLDTKFNNVTVAIQLDSNPTDINWTLVCLDGSNFESPPYGEDDANRLVVETVEVLEGVECELVVHDSKGNGIENGTIIVYEGTDINNSEHILVNDTGDFTFTTAVEFEVESLATEVPSFQPTIALGATLTPTSKDAITIVIQLDSHPYEISWQLQCNGTILKNVTEGTYINRDFELIVDTLPVEEGEYCVFSIRDSHGDGLQGSTFIQVFDQLEADDDDDDEIHVSFYALYFGRNTTTKDDYLLRRTFSFNTSNDEFNFTVTDPTEKAKSNSLNLMLVIDIDQPLLLHANVVSGGWILNCVSEVIDVYRYGNFTDTTNETIQIENGATCQLTVLPIFDSASTDKLSSFIENLGSFRGSYSVGLQPEFDNGNTLVVQQGQFVGFEANVFTVVQNMPHLSSSLSQNGVNITVVTEEINGDYCNIQEIKWRLNCTDGSIWKGIFYEYVGGNRLTFVVEKGVMCQFSMGNDAQLDLGTDRTRFLQEEEEEEEDQNLSFQKSKYFCRIFTGEDINEENELSLERSMHDDGKIPPVPIAFCGAMNTNVESSFVALTSDNLQVITLVMQLDDTDQDRVGWSLVCNDIMIGNIEQGIYSSSFFRRPFITETFGIQLLDATTTTTCTYNVKGLADTDGGRLQGSSYYEIYLGSNFTDKSNLLVSSSNNGNQHHSVVFPIPSSSGIDPLDDEPTTLPDDEPTTLPDDEPTTMPNDEPTTLPADEPTSMPRRRRRRRTTQ